MREHCWNEGPGCRLTIWMQGCSLHCPGCMVPETHDPKGGVEVSVKALFGWIERELAGHEGLTIVGGEPLDQPKELLQLLKLVRSQTKLGVVVFTGRNDPSVVPEWKSLKKLIDVVAVGPYVRAKAQAGLLGSSNQCFVYLTKRYDAIDFGANAGDNPVAQAEKEVLP